MLEEDLIVVKFGDLVLDFGVGSRKPLDTPRTWPTRCGCRAIHALLQIFRTLKLPVRQYADRWQPDRLIAGWFIYSTAPAVPDTWVCGRVNQKRLPLFNSLSTPICPPITSMSDFAIARPKPLPPLRRVRDLSER